MSSFRLLSIAALLTTSVGLLSSPLTLAQDRESIGARPNPPRAEAPAARAPEPRRERPTTGRERSMSESVRWAQKTTGGQVLGAERVQSDGRDFTRVKLIDGQGRVRYVDDVQQGRRSAGGRSGASGEPSQGQPRD